MIVLKIILYVILAVLGLVILLLLMPVGVNVSFIGGKLEFMAKYAFIPVYGSDGRGLVGKLLAKKKKKKKKKPADDFADFDEADIEPSKKKRKKRKKKKDELPPDLESLADETSEVGTEDDTEVSSEDNTDAEITDSADTHEENTTSDAEDTVTADDDTEDDDSEADDESGDEKKTLGEKVGFLMDIWNSAKRPVRKIFKGFHFSNIYIDFIIADEDAYKCAIKYGRVCCVTYNGLAAISGLFTAKLKSVDIQAGFAEDESRWDAACNVWFIPMTAVIAGLWFLITYLFRIYLPNKRKNKKKAGKAAASRKAECEV